MATPWNPNLTYAIDWCIALGVPVVYLTGRHILLLLTQAVASRRWSGRISNDNSGGSSNNLTEDAEDEEEQQHTQESGASKKRCVPVASSRRWSYSRLENWVANKSSATLYLGPYIHLVAGATLLALIFLSILAILLLTDVDLMRNSNRAGFLGLSCIPFLFAFTGKNSIISIMTGMSHHRINQVHRFLGLCLVVLISVHMGCMFYVWRPWKFLLDQELESSKVQYGLATYTTLCLIVVTASWPVRRWAYEAFVVSHFLFLVFLVLVSYHTPYAMRFTAAGIFFYVINVLTGWCVKSRLAFAQATVFQDRLTRLRMDRPMVYAPGQHVYVCVPSMSLIQWHPFTISSADQNSLTVHARAVGGFTRQLCRWPENTQRRVILAGPYGEGVQVGRGLDVHKIVFVAAGSGLSYVLPILMDLLHTRRLTKSSSCPIEVVWCVRDPDEVPWFQEELEIALDIAQGFIETTEKDKEDIDLIKSERPEKRLRVSIHYTNLSSGDPEAVVARAPSATSPVQPNRQSSFGSVPSASSTTARTALNAPFSGDDRVQWVKSRLDAPEYVRRQIQETPGDKVLEIVGCGPPLLLAQLHNSVAAKEQLSGCRVLLHTERFYTHRGMSTHATTADTAVMTKHAHEKHHTTKAAQSRKGLSKSTNGDSLTIVIKLGTSSICDEVTHFPLLSTLSLIIETILKLKALGHRVVLVTSGAIGVGLRRLDLASKPKDLAKVQAIAAVGQGRLMSLYDDLFSQFNQPIAQILLTKNDLADRTQYLNACNTIDALLEMDVVPIVNENDTISVSEIRFGDNDTLSAITAGMIHADYLFLMTDVDCLYTDNPRINPDAQPVLVVDDITALKEKVSVATAGSSLGTGGMVTKLIAAELATAAGVTTVITRGSTPQRIFQIISQPIQHTGSVSPKNESAAKDTTSIESSMTATRFAGVDPASLPLHTRFLAKDNPMVDRKWWILHGLHAAGTIYIDRGAYKAITNASQKSSLFAAGIVGCKGTFVAQQSVRVVYRPKDALKKDQAEEGKEDTIEDEPEEIEVGKGLVNYASHEILRIMGCHSRQIIDKLGYADAECVIHRENLTRTKLTAP
ncbi:hypothetical protein BGX28_006471 [Mortierella sp. GBA30]|nr:hypothetical protein BGX28_006471 [Mortierella sp. GBA30]